jgi:hypothetical protein
MRKILFLLILLPSSILVKAQETDLLKAVEDDKPQIQDYGRDLKKIKR